MITLIPPVDRSEEVVAFSQTLLGRVGLVAVFGVGLILQGRPWWAEVSLILLLMTLLPTYRWQLLLAGTLFWVWQYMPFKWLVVTDLARDNDVFAGLNWPLLQGLTVAAALFFCATFYTLALRYRDTPPMNRPLRALLCTYIGLLALASWVPLSPVTEVLAWAFLIVLGQYLWFLAYSLLDIHSAERTPFIWQIGHYFPFWMNTVPRPTPIGKGAAYLRKVEAQNPTELAITQLKGIKLLYWGLILMLFRDLYQGFVYTGSVDLKGLSFSLPFALDIPTFSEVFYQSVAGDPAVWYLNWLALAGRFFLKLLTVAIWGHLIISVCRMAGFRALRNTYRPLRSATIAEFWNRYYYYFKELMVDCFFYPAYLRYFKRWPRFRLVFATMAAACFGNVLFHFLEGSRYIAQWGLWDALLAFRVYMVYGLLLGVAISLSQVRNRGRRIDRNSLRTRLLAPVSVLAFYCVLSIFDEPERSIPAMEYFRFALHLIPGL